MTKQVIKQKQVLIVKPFHTNEVPRDSWVWVFGSDESGRHTSGDAKIAHACFGYSYGISRGGLRKAYGIPVFDKKMKPLNINVIRLNVREFLEYAHENISTSFHVAKISANGICDLEIASMFISRSSNCSLPEEWADYYSIIK